ncbi:hypothetical protein PBI_ELVA_53 [Microbacterium phage Elva]|uniref:hypothetical protein n=1 Tax=Microbacterium phage Elva TaxID=2126929 RepID=UPI000D218C38|nr:hypothetical protein QDW20_gp53 [Microbacterium phage Elva]AVR56794.1 hypothetical protein PBI_ELVA_53 [Microbacterium phage Elva]
MTTTLTTAAVAEAIDQLVQERGPDYVYPADEADGCYYSFEDGTPACLVGAVVAKLAPEAFDRLVLLEAPVDDGNGGIYRRKAGGVYAGTFHEDDDLFTRDIGVAAPLRVRRALAEAQRTQDVGRTWAEAREEFIAAIRES